MGGSNLFMVLALLRMDILLVRKEPYNGKETFMKVS